MNSLYRSSSSTPSPQKWYTACKGCSFLISTSLERYSAKKDESVNEVKSEDMCAGVGTSRTKMACCDRVRCARLWSRLSCIYLCGLRRSNALLGLHSTLDLPTLPVVHLEGDRLSFSQSAP